MSTTMSDEMKEEFKKRLRESIKGVQSKAPEEVEKVKEEAKKVFDDLPPEEAGKHQKMFSKLFFDPEEIGMPDFPVDTFHHLHKQWPEKVVNDVPKPDPFYVLNKHITYAFVAGDDEHAFLVGMPGCGKTTLPFQVAAITGRPVFKQSFQNDLESDEWIMSKEIDDTGTHWSILPFVESLEYPYYAVLDEFNRLRRGGRLLMNRLLDKGGSMQLRDGREVWPHSQWRAIATDNTRGMGDGLDKFDGDVADISTTDRFGLMIEVPYLPQEDQVKLAMNWFPKMNEEMAKEIVQFGEKVIAGYKVGTFPLPWTPRRMEKACKLALRYRNPVAGLRDAYFNFLAEDDERKACNQCLKDVGLAAKYGNFGE